MKIFGFLNGLGREYVPVTTVIQSSLTKLPMPTFNDVLTEIQAFDSKLQTFDAEDSTNTLLAFNTQRSGYDTNYRTQGYNQRGGRGRFGSSRGRGGFTSRGRGFSQHQTNSNGPGERPVCQICGRTGHTAVKCYNRFDNNYQGQQTSQAFSALQSSDATGKEWYPDSGASAHITASRDNLQSSSPYEGDDTIMVADGTYLPITHVGSANIKTTSEGGSKGSES
uniref:Retrovirus-related Pol polyprotein from transposon TNT 1-94-like beta-barrel domain-containing protein n=1 Tax=Noccaea caerulescens TaxID=107243 RepID=A0A1J3HJH5_NOCCA